MIGSLKENIRAALTVNNVQSEELLGGGRGGTRTPAADATVSRVLDKGEPVPAARGRADNFSWPRSGIEGEPPPGVAPRGSTPATVGASTPPPREQAGNGEPKSVQRRARNRTGEGPLQPLRQIFPGLFRF
jgi:hypothetical protein